jgi:hypothetical protein
MMDVAVARTVSIFRPGPVATTEMCVHVLARLFEGFPRRPSPNTFLGRPGAECFFVRLVRADIREDSRELTLKGYVSTA